MISFLQKLLGDPNKAQIDKLAPIVRKINQMEVDLQELPEHVLLEKIPEFKARIQDYVKKEEETCAQLMIEMEKDEVIADPYRKKITKQAYDRADKSRVDAYERILWEILPEVFAVVKNACRRLKGRTFTVRGQERTWEIIPFDVQLIGGIVLHRGQIAEMRTGEGKTFVASLPVILNALTGRGVHVITVNDYLAQRDGEWIGFLYNYLGLEYGVVVNGMSLDQKKEAYARDITYGTNNEFGFDYLRDNMAVEEYQMVQRPLNFAIVDEVDSILIDEARTPLIISAPADESTEKYLLYAKLIDALELNKHFKIDEKLKTATLTEEGIQKMEALMGVENIYTEAGFREVHHIEQALKAHACYKKDIDYVVREGEVVIIDEFTGRMLAGRRYSEGLHQAIEAKEAVEVRRESMTLATVTFQNLFRMYNKLAGMTGTAMTEAEEFSKIYKLEVIAIPTNRPVQRVDKADAIFSTQVGKYQAVVREVKIRHEKGQPTLIGTISIEKSEYLSTLLTKEGIPHTVLNAKFHEKEAEIVAGAGQAGAVTIATNMAGRGTDIKLGDGVDELGGLSIIGTERHESRRIDNQLRGRSGRQGDHGDSQFYVSMEDDLMRIFGGDRMKSIMQTLQVPEDLPIEHGLLSKQIEQAQKRVESHHFDTREHVVKYDDVMNKHREIVYARRKRILAHKNLRAEILELFKNMVSYVVATHTSGKNHLEWKHEEIVQTINALFPHSTPLTKEEIESYVDRTRIEERVQKYVEAGYALKEQDIPDSELLRKVERSVYLRSIDVLWMEHLENMQYLRTTVAMKSVGQKDPLVEYKQEAFLLFEKLLTSIETSVVNTLLHMDFKAFMQSQISTQSVPDAVDPETPSVIVTNQQEVEDQLYSGEVQLADVQRKQIEVIEGRGPVVVKEVVQDGKVPERNEQCPCGSGKKYKKCHGA